MQARYTIEIDAAQDLIRVELAGFFTPDDIADFGRAQRDAHRQLRCRRHQHLTLGDLRAIAIQSQEAVTAFRRLLAVPEFRARRLAFAVGTSLARGQLNRALGGRDARLFGCPQAAEAWLLAADPSPETG